MDIYSKTTDSKKKSNTNTKHFKSKIKNNIEFLKTFKRNVPHDKL